jgi:hypothetical protein
MLGRMWGREVVVLLVEYLATSAGSGWPSEIWVEYRTVSFDRC